MTRKMYSMKLSFIMALASLILLTSVITGLVVSHAVTATDSSAPVKKETTPVGTVVSWAGEAKSIPKNWMLCDGKLLDRRKYPDLFKAIGTSWGGHGSKFNLPDLRGRFLRGDDAGSNRDPDRNQRSASRPGGNKTGIGSVQEDAMQNHAHNSPSHSHGYLVPTGSIDYNFGGGGSVYFTVAKGEFQLFQTSQDAVQVTSPKRFNTKSPLNTSDESRPINAAVHWIIKVK